MAKHPILRMSDEAFGWYLTGLTDGEGCFNFRVAYRQGTRPAFQGTFGIAMRDDDSEGLRAIRSRIGIGRLYPDLAASRSGKGNPQLKWEVAKAGDLFQVLIPHFDAFPLRLKKGRDYARSG